MKKLLLALCLTLMGTGAFAQDYYDSAEGGDWGVGFGLTMGSGSGFTDFGFQLPKLMYYFTGHTRAEFTYEYFIKKDYTTVWDVNLNVHPYVIPMKYGLSVYPVAGLTFVHTKVAAPDYDTERDGHFGFNIGGGLQYDITESIFANFEAVYQYVNDFDRAHFALGIVYRF